MRAVLKMLEPTAANPVQAALNERVDELTDRFKLLERAIARFEDVG